MTEPSPRPTDAAPESQKQAAPAPAKPVNGPGLMILFGLGALVVVAWCLIDELRQAGTGGKWAKNADLVSIWFNRVGMAAGLIGAAYCFITAARRAKKLPPSDAGSPPSA
jgi:hypothetical protein